MKIYFEDGALRNATQLPVAPNYIVSADEGVSANINFLNNMHQYSPDSIVYTNSIFAFDNRYAWNEELQAPEAYIRAGGFKLFTRIDELTERELREGHNLARLYVAGEFGN